MTITAFIKQLQKIAKKHPKLPVIVASDPEGNSFNPVDSVYPCSSKWDESDGMVDIEGGDPAPQSVIIYPK